MRGKDAGAQAEVFENLQSKLEKEYIALEKKEDETNQAIWQNENAIQHQGQELERLEEALSRDSQPLSEVD